MKQLSIYDSQLNDEVAGFPPAATAQFVSTQVNTIECEATPIALELKETQSAPTELELGRPETRMTEIILSKEMADNLQLILPMLAHLNQDNRWLAWVNPPIQLLKQWQHKPELSIEDIMVLRSDQRTSAFELAKKALKAGTCHAVIVWTDSLTKEQLDHLDQASLEGGSHGIVLRYR